MSRITSDWLVLVLLSLVSAFPTLASSEPTSPGTVLITGSNRGIGLAFAEFYAQHGWQVIATTRSPEHADELQALAKQYANLSIEELDISDPAEVAAVAKRHAGQPIDVLLNNAAYLGDTGPQKFGQLDYELFAKLVDINLVGPLRLTEALVENVAASRQRKVIIMGSAAGSNGMLGRRGTRGNQLYAYRSSKAGLHLAAHMLAIDLAPRGIIVGLLNPGMVDTKGLLDLKPGDPVPEVFVPLLSQIESGALKLARPADAVAKVAKLIDSLDAEKAGRFWDVDGQELPW